MPESSQGVDAQETVDRLYTEWFIAARAHDDDWYRANLADEFVYVMANGAHLDLEEIIQTANRSDGSHYALLSVRGRRYGDMIIATGQFLGQGTFPEGDPKVTPQMREQYIKGQVVAFTGSWIERDGELRCLHLQGTPVTD